MCPRCLQEVTADMRVRERYHRCSLCNRELTLTSDVVPAAAPAAEDIAQQLVEARVLLDDALADRAEAETTLEGLRVEERNLSSALNTEIRVYVSPDVD